MSGTRRSLLTLLCSIAVLATAVALARSLQAQTPAAAPSDPATCKGVLGQNRVGSVLSAVPRYGSTYVFIVPQRLAAQVPNANAPGIKDLEVGVQSGTAAADVARAMGIRKIREYPLSEGSRVQPLQDIKDGKLDAAIMWAPLAGLGIIELELDEQVTLFTVDKPHAGPTSLQGEVAPDPCAAAVADVLDVNGVLPAELLVSIDIRDFLGQKPPADNLAQAREGGTVFNQVCSRCHGPDAVADPHGLAPVDLRISTPRFTWPGFHYIVLNGRPQKSMPAFRGTLTDEQIGRIYQYLRARSQKMITSDVPEPSKETSKK